LAQDRLEIFLGYPIGAPLRRAGVNAVPAGAGTFAVSPPPSHIYYAYGCIYMFSKKSCVNLHFLIIFMFK
jgi:hypothetical protein